MAKIAKQRMHGILRPRLSSAAALFEQRGDKWGGANRPQVLPHNPTASERAVEAALKKLDSTVQVTMVTKHKMPSGRWITRKVRTEEVVEIGVKSASFAAETASRLKAANKDDPDMDRWTKALQPQVKVETKQPRGTPIEATPQRSVTNALHKMNMAMRPKHVKVKDKRSRSEACPVEEEQKILRLVQEGFSREKARQLLEAERKAEAERRADYAAKKFGR